MGFERAEEADATLGSVRPPRPEKEPMALGGNPTLSARNKCYQGFRDLRRDPFFSKSSKIENF